MRRGSHDSHTVCCSLAMKRPSSTLLFCFDIKHTLIIQVITCLKVKYSPGGTTLFTVRPTSSKNKQEVCGCRRRRLETFCCCIRPHYGRQGRCPQARQGGGCLPRLQNNRQSGRLTGLKDNSGLFQPIGSISPRCVGAEYNREPLKELHSRYLPRKLQGNCSYYERVSL